MNETRPSAKPADVLLDDLAYAMGRYGCGFLNIRILMNHQLETNYHPTPSDAVKGGILLAS